MALLIKQIFNHNRHDSVIPYADSFCNSLGIDTLSKAFKKSLLQTSTQLPDYTAYDLSFTHSEI